MRRALPYVRDFFKRADMLLFALSLICAVFGIVIIASATAAYEGGSARYVIVQTLALFIGMALYGVMTVIDVDILADKWLWLSVFNVGFLGLLILFGESGDTGNNGWLRFAGIGIQPTEVIKITFIIILAKQITWLKEHRDLNSVASVAQIVVHFGALFVYMFLTAKDLGSALVFFFIFAVMLFMAGLKLYWFILGIAAVAGATPLLWNYFLSDYQKKRILAPYDPSVDPDNTGINWQPYRAKVAVASGQLTGSGLGQGTQNQSSSLPAKHTDFIFSVVGEELGMIGCCVVILLLMLIVIRCVVIGLRSNNSMSMLVCFGIASIIVFQTVLNIGMCIGIAPVVGITLPFFSYGGSSLFATFAAMGVVSGVKYRPKPQRYRRVY